MTSSPGSSHLCDRPQLPVRLDKYLREAAGMTRREVQREWEQARVEAPVEHPGELVFPGDEVRVDGVLQTRRAPAVYQLLNKPAGVLTARSDPYGRACLEPWLGAGDRPVFPVGRLDRATTGLLLLTDDGDLAHLLMHPDFHVPKTYLATLAPHHREADVEVGRFEAGLRLRDGDAKALSAEVVGAQPNVVLRIVVDEGRNHLVRNMVHVAGYELAQLHRVRVGQLKLGELESGRVVDLTGDQIEGVWRSVGGRERVWSRRHEALVERARRWRSEGRPHERLDSFLKELER